MQRRTTSLYLFWSALGVLVYGYIGFPLLAALRALLAPRPVRRDETYLPTVSLIIAAHNEADVIVQKLENAAALDYPADLVEVIVASDGSDDATEALVAQHGAANVRLLALPRAGKNRTLNAAVTEAGNDILVFSDADSMLQSQALRQLVAPLADAAVGGVGGDYQYAKSAAASGERSYWSFDRALKRWQSTAGSMTSATGQLFAMRRELFQPMPDGVTDDFFSSVQVPTAHKRLVFAPEAVATGPVATSAKAEFRRKVRVVTAGLRGVWLARAALDPRTHGLFALQLFSHKLLRRLNVVPLVLLSVTAPMLARRSLAYRLVALGLWGIHGLGALGFLLRGTKLGHNKLFSLPFFFEMVNGAVLVSLYGLLRGDRQDTWVPERNAEPTTLTSEI